MAIETIQIATNRYAPEGAQSISLYKDDLAQGLTLTQLVQQVCIRAAAAYEAQSVAKMNAMAGGSQRLSEAADVLEGIVSGDVNWSEAKTFLVNRMGIPMTALPNSIVDGNGNPYYPSQIQAATVLQEKMNVLAQTQQEDMIDLQTMVNKRDVAYSTSSGVVRAMGQSMSQDAQNFI